MSQDSSNRCKMSRTDKEKTCLDIWYVCESNFKGSGSPTSQNNKALMGKQINDGEESRDDSTVYQEIQWKRNDEPSQKQVISMEKIEKISDQNNESNQESNKVPNEHISNLEMFSADQRARKFSFSSIDEIQEVIHSPEAQEKEEDQNERKKQMRKAPIRMAVIQDRQEKQKREEKFGTPKTKMEYQGNLRSSSDFSQYFSDISLQLPQSPHEVQAEQQKYPVKQQARESTRFQSSYQEQKSDSHEQSDQLQHSQEEKNPKNQEKPIKEQKPPRNNNGVLPAPKIIICYHCGQQNHYAPDCPQLKNKDSNSVRCFNCKKYGHQARQCPEPKICNKCKNPGHISSQCPTNRNPAHFSRCHNCNQNGHFAKDCHKPIKCYLCHQHGHEIKDCPKNRQNDPNLILERQLMPTTCFNCNKRGHVAGECPEPKKCRDCGKLGHYARECPGQERARSVDQPFGQRGRSESHGRAISQSGAIKSKPLLKDQFKKKKKSTKKSQSPERD